MYKCYLPAGSPYGEILASGLRLRDILRAFGQSFSLENMLHFLYPKLAKFQQGEILKSQEYIE